MTVIKLYIKFKPVLLKVNRLSEYIVGEQRCMSGIGDLWSDDVFWIASLIKRRCSKQNSWKCPQEIKYSLKAVNMGIRVNRNPIWGLKFLGIMMDGPLTP